MIVKIIGILVTLLVFIANAEARNQTLGWVPPSNHLVHQEKVFVESSWFRVKTHTFSVPYNGKVSSLHSFSLPIKAHTPICLQAIPSPIRAIVHLDLKTAGNGPDMEVLNGGVGFQFATIRLKSSRGHGINSLVQFFTN